MNNPKTQSKRRTAEQVNSAKRERLDQHVTPQLPRYMDLSKGMPVKFGNIEAMIFGGPFRHYIPGQRRLVSVKMAKEINHPHDISIPTEDFSVPDMEDMGKGIDKALKAIVKGNDIYAGCMGGIGRTGLFMACMAKIMMEYEMMREYNPKLGTAQVEDPIIYVRKHYDSHAVETQRQVKFVEMFPADIYARSLWLALNPSPKVERVEVPVYHFNPFLAFAQWWGGK